MREVDFPTPYDKDIEELQEWQKRNAFHFFDIARHAPSTLSYKYCLLNDLMGCGFTEEVSDMLKGKHSKDKPTPWSVQRSILAHPDLTSEDVKYILENSKYLEQVLLEDVLSDLENEGR